MMNHDYIEEHQVIDRYILNKLTDEEHETFSNHFLNCNQCLEQLELAEAFQDGVKAVAANSQAAPKVIPFPNRMSTAITAIVAVVAVMVIFFNIGPMLQQQDGIKNQQITLVSNLRSDGVGTVIRCSIADTEQLIFQRNVLFDNYSHFRVSLQDQKGAQVWQDQILSRDGKITFQIPTSTIKPSAYTLRLEKKEEGFITIGEHHIEITP